MRIEHDGLYFKRATESSQSRKDLPWFQSGGKKSEPGCRNPARAKSPKKLVCICYSFIRTGKRAYRVARWWTSNNGKRHCHDKYESWVPPLPFPTKRGKRWHEIQGWRGAYPKQVFRHLLIRPLIMAPKISSLNKLGVFVLYRKRQVLMSFVFHLMSYVLVLRTRYSGLDASLQTIPSPSVISPMTASFVLQWVASLQMLLVLIS